MKRFVASCLPDRGGGAGLLGGSTLARHQPLGGFDALGKSSSRSLYVTWPNCDLLICLGQ
jgi:hypothetical protein